MVITFNYDRSQRNTLLRKLKNRGWQSMLVEAGDPLTLHAINVGGSERTRATVWVRFQENPRVVNIKSLLTLLS